MNPWGEYKRRKPANAALISSLSVQGVFVLIIVACAYYALKCKPFQSFSLTQAAAVMPAENAHPVTRHNAADEKLLKRVAKVAPIAQFTARISLSKGKQKAL